MKKKVFFLTLLFTILMSCTAFCADNDGSWINWSAHDLYTPPTDVWARQQYKYYLIHDNHPGVTIFYNNGNLSKLWYLSYYNTATIREQYLDGSGTSYTNMSALNSAYTVIDSNFWTNFTLEDGKTLYGFSVQVEASSLLANNSDIVCTSTNDLKTQLVEMGWQNPEKNDSGSLPFLPFTLEQKIVPQLSLNITTTKEIFKWNYAGTEPYRSNPSNYTIEIIAWANFKSGGVGEIFDADNYTINGVNKTTVTDGGVNISQNEYSFLYDNIGKSVWSKSGKDFVDDSANAMSNGYMLGIRTKTNDGNLASYYKVFIVQAGGSVSSTGMIIKPDGTVANTEADNGNDNISPNNQAAPQYSADNNTTAQADPTSNVYDGDGSFNLATVLNEFKGIVNTLGDIPSVFWQVFTFLPPWFISMFAISLTIMLAIGIVKLVVK